MCGDWNEVRELSTGYPHIYGCLILDKLPDFRCRTIRSLEIRQLSCQNGRNHRFSSFTDSCFREWLGRGLGCPRTISGVSYVSDGYDVRLGGNVASGVSANRIRKNASGRRVLGIRLLRRRNPCYSHFGGRAGCSGPWVVCEPPDCRSGGSLFLGVSLCRGRASLRAWGPRQRGRRFGLRRSPAPPACGG